MVENILSREKLSGISRKKNKQYDIKTIHKADLNKFLEEGWIYFRELKSSIQVKKDKPHGRALEDRVWGLFYRMAFGYLSGEGGAKLTINSSSQNPVKSQLDIVAVDTEVALVIECKSSKEFKKRPEFQEELAKFSISKECFTRSIKQDFSNNNLKIIYLMFLSNINLTESDKERAKNEKVILFDEKDLTYYEQLINHLGLAAKYQVLADMLPGKEVAGLSIKIPAIKTKMGGYNCYTFSISPEYLLKISYVSHRAKGKASDINTYQRMLAKSRLKKIREYISDEGIFPTNIVLNFERGRLNFQRSSQLSETPEDIDVGILGWLDIRPAYKSAWIIDGQHRLFAYSGHDRALKSKLSVLAFEGLKPSKQAELFIDINAKQKSVKLSLLQELYAELHWDAENPAVRISAIISKTIQDLNNDPECELYQRIQSTDAKKDFIKCITLTSIFGQLEKKGFFIVKEKHGSIVEYGPLWGGDNNLITLARTTIILKAWINNISQINKTWWDIGSGIGGGLAMNDGIASLILVLRSVFEVLELKGIKLIRLQDHEVCNIIKPYSNALGEYLSTFDESQRKAFRDLRGIEGMTYRTRQCQQGIRVRIPDFNPDGLNEWIELQKQQTNKSAKDIIDNVEVMLQNYIVSELQREYGIEDDHWWYEGVPSPVRQKVSQLMEEDKNKRGGKEYYFDLIHYRRIIIENWELFERTFAFGSKGNKDKKTEWLEFINETRKIVAHPSSGKIVSIEDYTKLEEFHNWLITQIQEADKEPDNDKDVNDSSNLENQNQD
ncbi:MAG: DGQHR domain-containing protein [Bacteroidales bacterium]|jgi:DGQHR domain-containing protein